MDEPKKEDLQPESTLNKWFPLVGILFGFAFLGVSWFAYSTPSEGNSWVYVIRIPMLLLGLQLITNPFRKHLKRFFLTRVLYWLLQIVSLLVFAFVYAFALFGRVLIAMICVFALTTMVLSKSLEYLEVQNPLDAGLFLAFTLSAILFSFKGNQIVNWLAIKMEGGDAKDIEGDLKIINKFLGASQIRYIIYCLYFVLIIIFTVLHLIEKLPNENDQNVMFLTLQSFAAFVAFDTMVEKRSLMKPWFDLAKNIDNGVSKLKKTSFRQIFREED